jgi:acyl-CoA thioesterase-1
MCPRRSFLAAAALFALAACDDARPGPAEAGPADAGLAADPVRAPLVVFLGDSLTAGSGLSEDEAFPAVIGERARAEGRPLRVVNAGVSGDTSAGGLARLAWLLAQEPAVVVVALGGNDGLRGLPVEALERNLTAIVAKARESGATVLLAGMRMPPNYGDYARAFEEVYPRVAKALDVPLVPFLLEGVGGVSALNQADGIHPNAKGQQQLAATVWERLERLLPEE